MGKLWPLWLLWLRSRCKWECRVGLWVPQWVPLFQPNLSAQGQGCQAKECQGRTRGQQCDRCPRPWDQDRCLWARDLALRHHLQVMPGEVLRNLVRLPSAPSTKLMGHKVVLMGVHMAVLRILGHMQAVKIRTPSKKRITEILLVQNRRLNKEQIEIFLPLIRAHITQTLQRMMEVLPIQLPVARQNRRIPQPIVRYIQMPLPAMQAEQRSQTHMQTRRAAKWTRQVMAV
ncbi:hypothetical protein F5Y19DRAFT_449787 [Xylariaceae sp. FL1651]|nr:hypothetical protein F5Y19DRAFT_449787 [Xylariaceae sp. FL1651]